MTTIYSKRQAALTGLAYCLVAFILVYWRQLAATFLLNWSNPTIVRFRSFAFNIC